MSRPAARVPDSRGSARSNRAIGSVVFVGTGFSLIGQTTLEALAHIERAQKLLYLVSEPAAAHWLQSLNPTAESLSQYYGEGKPRMRSYEEMVERILSHVRGGEHVTVALYGHPGVGVDPTHMVMAQARAEGLPARIQPGVSSDACLFADLAIDPMDDGVQAYEASRFLARRPRFDTSSGLILWQAGFVGEQSIKFSGQVNARGVRRLVSALRTYYPATHRVAAYEASWYPVCPPHVAWTELRSLARAVRSTASTVYVPALAVPRPSRRPRARR